MADNAPSFDFQSILSGILSNPDALSNIKAMAGNMAGMADIANMMNTAGTVGKSDNSFANDTAVSEENSAIDKKATPLLSHASTKENTQETMASLSSSAEDRRKHLMHALRPFLPEERQQALDRILQMNDLMSVFKALK